MPVVEITSLPREERERVVNYVFDNAHPFTQEDVVWTKEQFGLDEPACRQMFIDMDRLCLLERGGEPMYLFGKTPDGKLSTASAASLEGAYWQLTKDLIRYSRTPEGRDFCRDAVGFVEDSDLQNGTVRANWTKALGFYPVQTVDFQGATYHACHFLGDN